MIVPNRRIKILLIAMAKFKTQLSKETVEKNMKDIGADTESGVKYNGTLVDAREVRYSSHVRGPGRKGGDEHGFKKSGPDGY